jgi:hypothetical protein
MGFKRSLAESLFAFVANGMAFADEDVNRACDASHLSEVIRERPVRL